MQSKHMAQSYKNDRRSLASRSRYSKLCSSAAGERLRLAFFGKAIESALSALDVAKSIAAYTPNAFNLWKAVGDGCTIFSCVQERLADFPLEKVDDLLRKSFDVQEYKLFADVDGVGPESLDLDSSDETSESSTHLNLLRRCVEASILAQKRAIISSSHDIHAQAVAWYNLGWTEYRAHVCLERNSKSRPSNEQKSRKRRIKYLKAAMRCFKRAIELEASNSDFWNALGVVTTQLSPKVAQHSFIRALHLNERDVKAWTNLGVLYLLQNDIELAHKAFNRAQSTDPEYAHAWVGEGLVALIIGDAKEAFLHFTHAFEISDSASSITKSQFALHSFDHLVSASPTLSSTIELIRPLFALQQLHAHQDNHEAFDHLSALYSERVGSYGSAVKTLSRICDTLEEAYESDESPSVVSRLALAKADLARNELATHDYASAAESADTALALTSDSDDDIAPVMSSDMRRKLRLSAHLTVGLAQHYLGNMNAALEAFQAALKESSAAPDVLCFLAEVLWAKGGEDERSVARDQLFDCVQSHPEHVGGIVLLGAMATIDGDEETLEAAREELEAFRISEGLSEHDAMRLERVLEATLELAPDIDEDSREALVLAETQKAVMLCPWKPTGWTRLADLTSEEFPARMALTTAERSVPPRGSLDAEDLASALAKTGTIADAQRAIFTSPWKSCGWEALAEVTAP